jgi:hypothetical protein
MEPTDSGAVTRLLPADCLAIEEIGASGEEAQQLEAQGLMVREALLEDRVLRQHRESVICSDV